MRCECNRCVARLAAIERVRLLVDLEEALGIRRQIALGGGELAVAEEFLDAAEVGTIR